MVLIDEDRRKLLTIARESIIAVLNGNAYPVDVATLPERLKQSQGVFVTLTKDGSLRGCIGYVETTLTLVETVAEVAQKAALFDPRFIPVQISELPEINIEISILSSFKKVSSLDEIIIGVHGVYLHGETTRALLLPQVAIEHGWDRDTLLQQLIKKAGLEKFQIDDPQYNLYTFTADVFNESLFFQEKR